MFSQELCLQRNCIYKTSFQKAIVPTRIVSTKPLFQRDCISTRTPFRVTVSQEPCFHRNYVFKGIVSQKSLSRNLLFDSTTPFHSIKAPIWQPQQFLTVFPQLYLGFKNNFLTIIHRHNSTKPQHIRHFTTSKPQPLPDGSSMFSL